MLLEPSTSDTNLETDGTLGLLHTAVSKISLQCHSDLPLSWFIYKFPEVYPPVASWYMGGVKVELLRPFFVCVRTHKRMCVRIFKLYPTLRNPVECSPPGPSVHVIVQASILEWVAIGTHWSGFLLQRIPDPWIKPMSPTSPALQVDSLPLCHLGSL